MVGQLKRRLYNKIHVDGKRNNAFAVIGMSAKPSVKLGDPTTWGKSAVVADPWFDNGIVAEPKDAIEKYKAGLGVDPTRGEYLVYMDGAKFDQQHYGLNSDDSYIWQDRADKKNGLDPIAELRVALDALAIMPQCVIYGKHHIMFDSMKLKVSIHWLKQFM